MPSCGCLLTGSHVLLPPGLTLLAADRPQRGARQRLPGERRAGDGCVLLPIFICLVDVAAIASHVLHCRTGECETDGRLLLHLPACRVQACSWLRARATRPETQLPSPQWVTASSSSSFSLFSALAHRVCPASPSPPAALWFSGHGIVEWEAHMKPWLVE